MAGKVRKKLAATISDYQFVFSSPEGQRVIYDLYRNCGWWVTSFVRGEPDATSFREGARSVALYINAKLKLDLKKLDELQKQGEANDGRAPTD